MERIKQFFRRTDEVAHRKVGHQISYMVQKSPIFLLNFQSRLHNTKLKIFPSLYIWNWPSTVQCFQKMSNLGKAFFYPTCLAISLLMKKGRKGHADKTKAEKRPSFFHIFMAFFSFLSASIKWVQASDNHLTTIYTEMTSAQMSFLMNILEWALSLAWQYEKI